MRAERGMRRRVHFIWRGHEHLSYPHVISGRIDFEKSCNHATRAECTDNNDGTCVYLVKGQLFPCGHEALQLHAPLQNIAPDRILQQARSSGYNDKW